ncbi:MAG: L-ribulose-5-phosphate 4-epimerase [Thermomicrobiales bacterium]|nr:MAG: L-ribulose-5-phosphate 4-epimerase [Thermomicrobiales bacterium]
MLLAELREQVVRVGMAALDRRIVYGTAGNFSIRDPETGLIAISPSGMPYPEITPADVVIVDEHGVVRDGDRRPSSETPMHTMIYREHPRVRAIVHTHSHYSTVVSTIRPFLPPILTEVCIVVGPRVPVTRYGLTGLDDIGRSVLEVMDDETNAVILKNHGLITFGCTFDEALTYATVVEEAAHVYIDALAANGGREPDLVPEAEIPGMRERFRTSYGQPRATSGTTR